MKVQVTNRIRYPTSLYLKTWVLD